jgi:hypothetical protein
MNNIFAQYLLSRRLGLIEILNSIRESNGTRNDINEDSTNNQNNDETNIDNISTNNQNNDEPNTDNNNNTNNNIDNTIYNLTDLVEDDEDDEDDENDENDENNEDDEDDEDDDVDSDDESNIDISSIQSIINRIVSNSDNQSTRPQIILHNLKYCYLCTKNDKNIESDACTNCGKPIGLCSMHKINISESDDFPVQCIHCGHEYKITLKKNYKPEKYIPDDDLNIDTSINNCSATNSSRDINIVLFDSRFF